MTLWRVNCKDCQQPITEFGYRGDRVMELYIRPAGLMYFYCMCRGDRKAQMYQPSEFYKEPSLQGEKP